MIIDNELTSGALLPGLERFWNHSARKLKSLKEEYDHSKGAPVYTVNGRYTSRSWTDWTRGFVFGSSLLQFDATGDESFLEGARSDIDAHMRDYLTHTGVHDHGFPGGVFPTGGHEKLHTPDVMRGRRADDGFMPSF